MEEKIALNGNSAIKIIRVIDGANNNRFTGNVIVSIRHLYDKPTNVDLYSVKVQYLSAKNLGKLSINRFEATVNHGEQTISFGPAQGMQLEEQLQNKGIGTFAFNELTSALRQSHPNYIFLPYESTLTDADESMKDKVVNFFSRFGIQAEFLNDEKTDIVIRAGTPIQIKSYYNEGKVKELDPEEFVMGLVSERLKNESNISNLKAEIEKMSEETIGGIPKKELIKYTLISCGLSVLVVFLLIM